MPPLAALAGTGIPTLLGTSAATAVINKSISGSGGGTKTPTTANGIPTPEFLQAISDQVLRTERQQRAQTGELNAQYRPGEINQQLQDLTQMATGLGPLSEQIGYQQGNLTNALNTLRGQGEIGRVRDQGPEFLNQIKRLNPSLYTQMDMQQTDSPMMQNLKTRTTGDLNQIGNIDNIFAQHNAQLMGIQDQTTADVARQGALSPEAMRTAQQQSRQADEARGMFRSSASNSNEILNTEAARQRKLAFDTQQLGNIQGLLGQSEGRNLAIRNSFIGNAGAVDQSAFGQGQQRIQNRINTLFDPGKAVLGRDVAFDPSSSNAMGNLNVNYGQSMEQPGGSAVTSLFNSLMNTTLAGNTFSQNNAAGQNAGTMGALGGILQNIDWGNIFGGGGSGGGSNNTGVQQSVNKGLGIYDDWGRTTNPDPFGLGQGGINW